MKVWITKYALTKGIYEAELKKEFSCRTIWIQRKGRYAESFDGKDWHKTKKAAIERAEEMQIKKIASLKKQIKKIESMTFE